MRAARYLLCNYRIAARTSTSKPKSWRLDRIENLMALDIPGLPSVDFDLAVLANGMLRLFNEEPKDVILHMLSEGYGRVQYFSFHATLKLAVNKSISTA